MSKISSGVRNSKWLKGLLVILPFLSVTMEAKEAKAVPQSRSTQAKKKSSRQERVQATRTGQKVGATRQARVSRIGAKAIGSGRASTIREARLSRTSAVRGASAVRSARLSRTSVGNVANKAGSARIVAANKAGAVRTASVNKPASVRTASANKTIAGTNSASARKNSRIESAQAKPTTDMSRMDAAMAAKMDELLNFFKSKEAAPQTAAAKTDTALVAKVDELLQFFRTEGTSSTAARAKAEELAELARISSTSGTSTTATPTTALTQGPVATTSPAVTEPVKEITPVAMTSPVVKEPTKAVDLGNDAPMKISTARGPGSGPKAVEKPADLGDDAPMMKSTARGPGSGPKAVVKPAETATSEAEDVPMIKGTAKGPGSGPVKKVEDLTKVLSDSLVDRMKSMRAGSTYAKFSGKTRLVALLNKKTALTLTDETELEVLETQLFVALKADLPTVEDVKKNKTLLKQEIVKEDYPLLVKLGKERLSRLITSKGLTASNTVVDPEVQKQGNELATVLTTFRGLAQELAFGDEGKGAFSKLRTAVNTELTALQENAAVFGSGAKKPVVAKKTIPTNTVVQMEGDALLKGITGTKLRPVTGRKPGDKTTI